MDAAEKLASDVGTAAACRAMDISRATVYRRRKTPSANAQQRGKRRQPRALLDQERQEVLDVLHSPQFVDKAPATVLRRAAGQRHVPLLDSHNVPHLA